MLLVGVGTDIIEIERIKKACVNSRFLERVFTVKEREYCFSLKNPYPSLAARFAAKEAVLKALETGLSGCSFKDVEIIKEADTGKPIVKLSGGAKKVAKEKLIENIMISISHNKTHAIAFAVAQTKSTLQKLDHSTNKK